MIMTYNVLYMLHIIHTLHIHVYYTFGVLMSTLPPVPCLPSDRDCSVLRNSSFSDRGGMYSRIFHKANARVER